MEKQGQNKTTSIESKQDFNKNMTIQLKSIKKEVLDEEENNCENPSDKQPTIVEQQKKQDQQQLQQAEQTESNNNEPEKIAEQIPSCYPGLIEAIRQAKGKKKSHDVSFQILFSCLPESIIKQHDIHLKKWWDYCLIKKKDPLETDLSVFIGHLEEKLDAGASRDELKSIASSVCLIASDKMASQIHTLSFLFFEFAKYSVLDENNNPTAKLSCQQNLLNNNKPKKNSVFDNAQSTTSVLKRTSTKPPAIFIRKRRKNEEENNKKTIPPLILKETQNDDIEQHQSTKPATNNNREIDPPTNDVASSTYCSKSLVLPSEPSKLQSLSTETLILAIKLPTPSENLSEDHSKQPLLPCHINTSSLECSNKALEQNKVEIDGNLLVETVQKEQHHQLPSANNNHVIDSPTKALTSAIKPATAMESSVNHDTSVLIQYQLNSGALEYSSQELKETKTETIVNLQSELQLGNTVEKEQQQHQIPSANNNQAIDSSSKDVATSVTSSVFTSLSEKSEHSINLDKSDTNSIPQISERSVNTDGLYHKTESCASLKKVIDINKVEKNQQQYLLPLENNNDELSNDSNLLLMENIDANDELLSYNNLLVDKKYLQNNINIKEPKYIDGKLAVCGSCSSTSMDFNRCFRCKKKIQNNPKTVAYKWRQAKNKDMIVAVDQFYKNVKVNNDIENHYEKLHTTFACRTVRIGSYKFTPKSPIIMNTSGLTLSVPLLTDETQTVKVHVKHQDIVQVLIHFSNLMPIIFFHTNAKSGSKIRELLGMYNKKKSYYDPTSIDQTQKRIILLPKILNGNSKIILKKLFSSNNLLQKLTAEKADHLLSSASQKNRNNSSLNIIRGQSTIGTIHTAKESIEKPKYVDGKLAVCNHCGFSSIDFNRCYYCERKIQNNPKTKLDSSQPAQKRHMMLSIVKFYKTFNHFDNDISPSDDNSQGRIEKKNE